MTREAYLTIDDSPSRNMDALCDWLIDHDVPALFFCRGAFLEQNPDPVVRAIERGFGAANHSYAHDRTSAIGLAAQAAQIERTHKLLEQAYRRAGKPMPGPFIRLPHMDRGAMGWVIDFDKAPAQYRDYLKALFWEGVRVETNERPAPEFFELQAGLQGWLARFGFRRLPAPDVTHPWFVESEMAQSIDAMYTFSTSDWMLTERHRGRWPYKTLDDLKARIDRDPGLQSKESAHIILAHDDRIDSLSVTTALIGHMLDRGFIFKELP